VNDRAAQALDIRQMIRLPSPVREMADGKILKKATIIPPSMKRWTRII
jgi:hypothetical protein